MRKTARWTGAPESSIQGVRSSHARPERLEPILQCGPGRTASAHMLQHPQLSSASQHSADFLKPSTRIIHATEDETADDRVESIGAKGERLDVPHHQWDR